jgi:hypothetical protein
MPLTKSQIIEIQEAAKFNTLGLMEQSKKAAELKKIVADKQREAARPVEVEAAAKLATETKSAKKSK